jgi:hypothetical protein
LNSAGVAIVLLSLGSAATNSTASAGNGVAIPPNVGMMLKAPWPNLFTTGVVSGTPTISAIVGTGGNTGSVWAQPGFGDSH